MFRTFASKLLAVFGLLLGLLLTAPTSNANATQRAVASRDSVGTLLATLADPRATSHDYFGQTVAMSGNTAVIGAPGTRSGRGKVYIYEKGPTGWPTTPTATLKDPVHTGPEFGNSVAVSGNTIVVGAADFDLQVGTAYIYENGKDGWPRKPTAVLSDPDSTVDDGFGVSVAAFEGTVVVGAWGTKQGAGAAYVYVKKAFIWPTTPTVTLSNPSPAEWDYFGFSVAISGRTIVVGSYGTDSDCGAAYIYVRHMSSWPTIPTASLPDPEATQDDFFGSSVAVSGTTVGIGSEGMNSNYGAVYIYAEENSTWSTTPTATLPDPEPDAYFGSSFLTLSGGAAVVGAGFVNSESGVAYIYSEDGSVWPTTPTVTLSDPPGQSTDLFGSSVALAGATALIGAQCTDACAGASYIYKS